MTFRSSGVIGRSADAELAAAIPILPGRLAACSVWPPHRYAPTRKACPGPHGSKLPAAAWPFKKGLG
jgi:hypothetical protein